VLPSPRQTACTSILYPQQQQRLLRQALVSPTPEACISQALACHPKHPAVLSGSAPGYIHLWRYVDQSLKATYAPLPFSQSLVRAPSAGVPQPHQVAHWKYATGVAFNAAGTRFAAVGKGGWVCMWRYDAHWANTPHGRVGCCDWSHHCVSKQGDAVAFVGGKSSLLLVGGRSSVGMGDLSLWDVLMPLPRACVGAAPAAQAVSDLAVSSDDVTVVVASRMGTVAAFDLRRLGPCRVDAAGDAVLNERRRGVLWAEERAHVSGATCATACPAAFLPPGVEGALVATGGQDGGVVLWDVRTGKRLQSLERLHWTQGRRLFGFGTSEERVGCKVKSLSFCESGMVSTGHNSAVMLTPWSAQGGGDASA
jgi:WD40 repeat protein